LRTQKSCSLGLNLPLPTTIGAALSCLFAQPNESDDYRTAALLSTMPHETKNKKGRRHGSRLTVFNGNRFEDQQLQRLDELAIPVSPKRRKVSFDQEQEHQTDLQQLAEPTIALKQFKEAFKKEEERQTIILSSLDINSHEKDQTTWLSPCDLRNIQQQAKTTSALVCHGANVQGCDLTLAHRKTTLMLAKNLRSLVKLSPTMPDQDLAVWCSHDDGRRGLERFASKLYNSFRYRDVTNTRMSVIGEQSRQRIEGINDPEAIAQVARTASCRARTFALYFGAADASQVKDDPGHVKPSIRQSSEEYLTSPMASMSCNDDTGGSNVVPAQGNPTSPFCPAKCNYIISDRISDNHSRVSICFPWQ
jgi:hypothetical protein